MNNGHPCPAPAKFRVFWPGHLPLNMCIDHAAKAAALCNIMGFILYTEPLPHDTEVVESCEGQGPRI
jgi:hypothetical protein